MDEWELYEPHHRARMAFRPGLTGMWQVSGRSNITDFEEVVKLDTKYISEWSLKLDMKILFQTVLSVFKSDEAVVVCPVDPYVDNTYYEAVKNLQELAEQGGANLTLMGIEPTYPSEKYGYIIPKNGENVSKVKEFK